MSKSVKSKKKKNTNPYMLGICTSVPEKFSETKFCWIKVSAISLTIILTFHTCTYVAHDFHLFFFAFLFCSLIVRRIYLCIYTLLLMRLSISFHIHFMLLHFIFVSIDVLMNNVQILFNRFTRVSLARGQTSPFSVQTVWPLQLLYYRTTVMFKDWRVIKVQINFIEF